MCILAKNWRLFGLDRGKINIYGVKMVTRCHLEIRVFFSSWKRCLFEEFWHLWLSLIDKFTELWYSRFIEKTSLENHPFLFLVSYMRTKGGNWNAQILEVEDKKMCNIPHHFSSKLTIPLLMLPAIFLLGIGCFVRKEDYYA